MRVSKKWRIIVDHINHINFCYKLGETLTAGFKLLRQEFEDELFVYVLTIAV